VTLIALAGSAGWFPGSPSTTLLQAGGGQLDSTFGNSGKVSTNFFDSNEGITEIALQSDGKIIVLGGGYRTNYDLVLSRFNTDGSLDTTFGEGGRVAADFFTAVDIPTALAIQPDGKILVGDNLVRHPIVGFAVARFKSNGALDKKFGDAGLASMDFFGFSDRINNLIVQPDGKIVGVGDAAQPGVGHLFAAARWMTDGSPDASFGQGGKVTNNFGDPRAFGGISFSQGTDVAIQSDGRIVVAGEALRFPTSNDFILARLNSDGSLDNTFGNNGFVSTDFAGNQDLGASLVIQPDGKILVGGFAANQALNFDFALTRYNSDGSLDNTFGTSGRVVSDFGGSQDRAFAVALQPNGKIIAAGEAYSAGTLYDFALARFNADGFPDASFGVAGRVTTDFFGDSDSVNSILIQSDGKILAAGNAARDSFRTNLALARYLGEGPRILSTRLKGTKLFIHGENFEHTATVFIDGSMMKARRQDSTDILLKKLALESGSHDVRVVNSDGRFSSATFVVN